MALLQELFPHSNPIHLVEGAPMLLALSDNTLRVKSAAWRHILESSLDVPWEQVRSSFTLTTLEKLWTAHQCAVFLFVGKKILFPRTAYDMDFFFFILQSSLFHMLVALEKLWTAHQLVFVRSNIFLS